MIHIEIIFDSGLYRTVVLVNPIFSTYWLDDQARGHTLFSGTFRELQYGGVLLLWNDWIISWLKDDRIFFCKTNRSTLPHRILCLSCSMTYFCERSCDRAILVLSNASFSCFSFITSFFLNEITSLLTNFMQWLIFQYISALTFLKPPSIHFFLLYALRRCLESWWNPLPTIIGEYRYSPSKYFRAKNLRRLSLMFRYLWKLFSNESGDGELVICRARPADIVEIYVPQEGFEAAHGSI